MDDLALRFVGLTLHVDPKIYCCFNISLKNNKLHEGNSMLEIQFPAQCDSLIARSLRGMLTSIQVS